MDKAGGQDLPLLLVYDIDQSIFTDPDAEYRLRETAKSPNIHPAPRCVWVVLQTFQHIGGLSDDVFATRPSNANQVLSEPLVEYDDEVYWQRVTLPHPV